MSADDLLARAKEFYERGTKLTEGIVLVGELADELERLRAERDALRSVVRDIVDDDCSYDTGTACRTWTPAEADAIRNAVEGTDQ